MSTAAATPSQTGKTTIDVPGLDDSSHSVAVLHNGQIRMVGLSSNGEPAGYTVVQLSASGLLDFAYNQDGIARLPTTNTPGDGTDFTMPAYANIQTSQISYRDNAYQLDVYSPGSHPNERPWLLASIPLPSDGAVPIDSSLQLAPEIPRFYGTTLASARTDTALYVTHVFGNGVVDDQFGVDGIATYALQPGTQYDGHTPLALQSDGKLLIAGYDTNGTDTDFSITRYNVDGTVDTSFADHGTATVDVAGGDDFAHGMAIQADGKVLVTGSSATGAGDQDFGVVRLNADGSLDSTFADGGKATFDFNGEADSAQTVTVVANDKILLTGGAVNSQGDSDFAALQLNADGSLDTHFGDFVDGVHRLVGSGSDDLIVGTAADEVISGGTGNDLLDGGAGRDQLRGGTQIDVFRFSAVDDSYRTATEAFSDRIVDFDPNEDRLDLAALTFTGLGDGYGHTLAVRENADASRTYLKSFEPDAQGHRLEIVLDGDLASHLNDNNVLFSPEVSQGTDGPDYFGTTAATSEMLGGAGNDNIFGNLGNDTLIGGGGSDRLSGYAGADTFRFSALEDSYRNNTMSFSDRILDFNVYDDRIDVSALGFTGLGDGHNGTLAVVVSANGDDTYLKNYDANAQGERFQLTLAGDLGATLSNDQFVFAQPGDAAEPVLLGVAADHRTVG